MPTLILFNKPFRVLSQFSPEKPQSSSASSNLQPNTCRKDEKETLARYIKQKKVYPAGRLDYDSEGLLLLTDDGVLQHRISHPAHKQLKTYWVQVEGEKNDEAIAKLRQGVVLKDGLTQAAVVECIPKPMIWPRTPPVRFRQSIPTHWLSLTISEGRNRQVRRMTAAVGLPTLRLIRMRVGDWWVDELLPGQYKKITVPTPSPLKQDLAKASASKKKKRFRNHRSE